MASYDAWIKLYRPDENTPNTAISYYTKGSLVGWLLDAKVRRATTGTRTLDDVMRTAYQRYAGPRGFTTDDFVGVVRDLGGADVASWLNRVISTTEELDYNDALSWFGLEFTKQKKQLDENDEPKPEKAYLGLTTKTDAGRLVVTQVKRGAPAFDAGVNVDDEIIAIDDYRVPPDGLDTRLEQYKAGDTASLVIARRGHLHNVPIKFAAEPENVWKLRVVEKPTAEQKVDFSRWVAVPTKSN